MGDLLKHPATYLAVPIAVYFLGWSYLDSYFSFFKIPLANLDLPIEHYFTNGFEALVRGAFTSFPNDPPINAQVTVFVSTALLVVALAAPLKWLGRARYYLWLVLAIVLMAGSWALVVKVARFDTLVLPAPVRIVLSDAPLAEPRTPALQSEAAPAAVAQAQLATAAAEMIDQITDEFDEVNIFGRIKLIYQHADYVVVGYPDCRDEERPETCEWMVWMLPMHAIRMTRVWEPQNVPELQPAL